MRYVYPCELTPERDGGYSVSFPNVPEALRNSKTIIPSRRVTRDCPRRQSP